MVKDTAQELSSLVEETAGKLKFLDKDLVSKKPAPNKWSVKEILGHLIDSAVNNHHRFVRAQAVDDFEFPDMNKISGLAYNRIILYHGMKWLNYGDCTIFFLHILFFMSRMKN